MDGHEQINTIQTTTISKIEWAERLLLPRRKKKYSKYSHESHAIRIHLMMINALMLSINNRVIIELFFSSLGIMFAHLSMRLTESVELRQKFRQINENKQVGFSHAKIHSFHK